MCVVAHSNSPIDYFGRGNDSCLNLYVFFRFFFLENISLQSTYVRKNRRVFFIVALKYSKGTHTHQCSWSISRGLPLSVSVSVLMTWFQSKSRENSKTRLKKKAKVGSITWAPYNWHGRRFGIVCTKIKKKKYLHSTAMHAVSVLLANGASFIVVVISHTHRERWISHASS